jgi:hypothetical protein
LSAVWGQGPRTLRSACEDLSVPDPLGPLYDLARDAQWALPQAIHERQGQRLRLFSDALEIFEAKAGPSLLVIEDLHWADDVLGRRIVNTHILLLLTARTDRSERQMRVRRALGEIPASSIVRIEVPLLSEAAVLSLAETAGRGGDAIYRATAGNAFFGTELLSAENETLLPACATRCYRGPSGSQPAPARCSMRCRCFRAGLMPGPCRACAVSPAPANWPNACPTVCSTISATATPFATKSRAAPSKWR